MVRFALKIIIISFLCLFSSEIYAQNEFVISGTVPLDEVDVELYSDNPKFHALKTTARNKEFHFSGSMNQEFEHVFLKISKNDKRLTAGWSFYIRSGEMKLKILTLDDKVAKNNIMYFNVPFVEEQNRYDSLIKPLQDNRSYSYRLLQWWKNDNRRLQHNMDSLAGVIKSLREEELSRKIEFVKANSKAYMALYTFNSEILTPITDFRIEPDSLMSIYSLFDESLKATDLGKSVYAYISKKQQLTINRVLPDFSFLTSNGQNYKLSSFRHKKYILLCFWDIYCIPCIKNIPLLKRLNETYAGKGLQMISISIDTDANLKAWKSSLERYDMPWLETCDLPPYIKEPKVRTLYDINYIPQYFLLDKDGKLIYHNTQLKDGDDYSILQELLENLMP